ncbi:MAG: LysM peptidoglycan-binding domain-containing protein [Phyllobacteriaceae bacterium]|nr:LysM peptidoglycan-binding domain-containing protein [Phyllobacteriaceae bacterium]
MANPYAGLWLFGALTAGTAIASTAAVVDFADLRAAWQSRFGTPAETVATRPVEEQAAQTADDADTPAEDDAQPMADVAPEEAAPDAETGTDVAMIDRTAEPPTLGDQSVLPDVATEPGETREDGDATLAAVVPRFDLLRAEPDGSLVIAGSGPAGATMEIIAGSRTIATATAGPTGDFAAVLDEPLAPGDYQIVLRATAPDGLVVTSLETAVVAIPEAGSNDVLALVEAPGAASRLITTPGPDTPVLETVAPEPEAVAADEGDTPPTDESETADAAEEPASDAPVELAALPETDEPAAVAAPEPTDAAPHLRIEAVEIDGAELFVAGAATPGTRLRLYANEMLLGDTTSSDGGRFLIQVRRDLPVGDYIIRADAIDPATGDVLRRVSVPFTRQAGERLAAIAVAPSARLPASPPTIPFDELAPDTQSDETARLAAPSDQTVQSPEGTDGSASVPQSLGVLQGPPPIGAAPAETAGELVPTGQSVIIRRGDTLWQISRRVYGQGVKYTTIYLANEEQISDPDRIWPGQVFAVPDEARADAEDVHRQLRSAN